MAMWAGVRRCTYDLGDDGGDEEVSERPDLRTNPGEIGGWPKLKVAYRTDPDRIADLLPPGLEPTGAGEVYVNVYCVPILGEPELGLSTKVGASFDGVDGLFCVSMGIDQEAAIFISQELNGQPKFPCDLSFYRLGDYIEARATHQGYTFAEFGGRVSGPGALVAGDQEENEWWVKYSRAIAGVEKQYDFPPHVVRVRSVAEQVHVEDIDGELVLRDSPWDPYTELLPMHEQLSAQLVTTRHKEREITNAGPLDPDAFWPYADTIGGSRWPGERGGPRNWRS